MEGSLIAILGGTLFGACSYLWFRLSPNLLNATARAMGTETDETVVRRTKYLGTGMLAIFSLIIWVGLIVAGVGYFVH